VLNELSIANCRSGLPRIPAVYRTQQPTASTYTAFFRTLLEKERATGGHDEAVTAAPEERLQNWLTGRIGESQHLEFKGDLALGNKKDKVEALKDLTGMGNGGGGVVAFGVAEVKTPDGESVADHIAALTDPMLPVRLKDIASSGVRPTLRVTFSRVDLSDGGYVLIADVARSPLGPYMVDAYDDHRYWRRIGTDARPMDERLVHDMYAEAERWQRNRAFRWEARALPLESPRSFWPWLTVSGIPEFDVGEPFDPARRDVTSLRYEGATHALPAWLTRLEDLGDRFAVWADGFVADSFGDSKTNSARPQHEQTRMRVHRDGSIGIGLLLSTPRRLDAVTVLNAHLSYCGQLWASAGVSAVDLRIELTGFGSQPANVTPSEFPRPPDRNGTPAPRIVVQELVRVADLVAASPRHRVLRRFADRLANLYGEATQRVGFEFGPLCTPAGRAPASAARAHIIYTAWSNDQPRPIASNGAVRQPAGADPIGWWRDGALLTASGDIVAVVEFPTIDELPDDFIAADIDPSEEIPHPDWDPERPTTDAEPPPCTGRWTPDPIESILTT